MKPVSTKISLAGLSPDELGEQLLLADIDRSYAVRLLYWVYRRGITSFDTIDDIPKKVIAKISERFITGVFAPYSSIKSEDGSIKYLFKNSSGLLYESVYIPEGKRHTICISVQSGCRMGCSFCATGSYGWRGNLTVGEIVNQVISVPHDITHVVFMGMGEPCDNIEEVLKACGILTAGWGMAKGRAHITVSTVGIMPELERLLTETRCNITLSLHSPFADERSEIIPAERQWPFMDAVAVMKKFCILDRRFTVAYVMIEGVNDTDRHLSALRELLAETGIRVNLLPYHRLPEDSFRSSSPERMMLFKHLLVTSGIGASVRRSRGTDVYAACGMLAATTGDNKLNIK